MNSSSKEAFETTLGSLAHQYLNLEFQEYVDRVNLGFKIAQQSGYRDFAAELHQQYSQRLTEVIARMTDLTVSGLMDQAQVPAVLDAFSGIMPVLNTRTHLFQPFDRIINKRNPSLEFATGVIARLAEEINKPKPDQSSA